MIAKEQGGRLALLLSKIQSTVQKEALPLPFAEIPCNPPSMPEMPVSMLRFSHKVHSKRDENSRVNRIRQ